jgi:POT family proton-dependent oligopeptide transporter
MYERCSVLTFQVADQYTETKLRIKTLKSQERVIIDRNLTLQSIYGLWYWCVNIGSLSGIATTIMERKIGFWAAYLLPTCFLWFATILLLVGRRRFGELRTSKSNVLSNAHRGYSPEKTRRFDPNIII